MNVSRENKFLLQAKAQKATYIVAEQKFAKQEGKWHTKEQKFTDINGLLRKKLVQELRHLKAIGRKHLRLEFLLKHKSHEEYLEKQKLARENALLRKEYVEGHKFPRLAHRNALLRRKLAQELMHLKATGDKYLRLKFLLNKQVRKEHETKRKLTHQTALLRRKLVHERRHLKVIGRKNLRLESLLKTKSHEEYLEKQKLAHETALLRKEYVKRSKFTRLAHRNALLRRKLTEMQHVKAFAALLGRRLVQEQRRSMSYRKTYLRLDRLLRIRTLIYRQRLARVARLSMWWKSQLAQCQSRRRRRRRWFR